MMWNDRFMREMEGIQRQFDRMTGNVWNRDNNGVLSDLSDYRRAFTKFKETETDYFFQIELPGIEKENIQLNVVDSRIEIKAVKKQEFEKEDKNKSEYCYSKSFAGFYRSFNIPENSDSENIDSIYKNGMLTIKIPKKFISKKKTVNIK